MNLRKWLQMMVVLLMGTFTTAHAEHYEIFLLAGQSNMDGRGSVKELTGDLETYTKPHASVLIHFSAGGLHRPLTNSEGIVPLQPGFTGSTSPKPTPPPTNMIGPEMGFGFAIAEALPGKHVLLIKFAEGGTNLKSDWNPAHKKQLYENFLIFVHKTQKMLEEKGDTYSIRGMLWHQGESDAGQPVGQYATALTEFIACVRRDLKQPELPFLIGMVYDNGKNDNIITDQKAVAKSVPNTAFVDVTGLDTFDKGTHFNAKSQIELGKRFAKEMTRFLQQPTKP